MVDALPAITVWQPWATLIAEGAKPWEFRGWPAPPSKVGLRIAIHAGARPMKPVELRALLYRLQQPNPQETGLVPAIAIPILERAVQAPKGALPLSSVLCTAVLGQPIRNAALAAAMGVPWLNDSDRNDHSNWGWPLGEIQRVEPYAPAKGSQGWWQWQPPATTVAFLPIDPRFPDQFYVHLGCSGADPRIGDVAAPAPGDDDDSWAAREQGQDGHWPGFRSRVEAGVWLAQRWLARRDDMLLPSPPKQETPHG